MKKHQREAVLISFFNEKEKYKKLAEYIVQLIQDDPSSPKESLHTIIYRIKDELRLIEKINRLNKDLEAGKPSITKKNYQARVCDLLGVRIICLRLSDVKKVETYLKLLAEENILSFVKGPDRKRSFILPANPGDSIPDDLDLRYSGYSSIHYQIELGENSDAPPGLKGLLFELQLRTILEEAWSEIDHKYRYVRSRIGVNFPEHIHTGFYNLSAYLQVAALQAEYLCRLAETHSLKKISKVKGIARIVFSDEFSSADMEKDEFSRKLSSSEIEKRLKKILKFKVTPRTLIYIEKRLEDVDAEEKPHKTLQKLLTLDRLLEFKTIFQEILNIAPFENARERNIDVINALNFGIFYELQGKRVAQEGLRAVLRWRKDRSIC
ncbi:MAG: RelA/SpoT domain-containing protein [Desulfobacterales bacterium]